MVEDNNIEMPVKHARFNRFFSIKKLENPDITKEMFFFYNQRRKHDYGRRMFVPHEGLLVLSRKTFSHELHSIVHLFNYSSKDKMVLPR